MVFTTGAPISAEDYCAFLNQNAASDPQHFYNEKMADAAEGTCVLRLGTVGSYRYQAEGGGLRAKGAEKNEAAPMSFLSQNDALQNDTLKNKNGFSFSPQPSASSPITFLSYNDAVAFCQWKSANDHHSFSLQLVVWSLSLSPQSSAFSLASLCGACDEDLKSNILTFQLIPFGSSVHEASGANVPFDFGLKEEIGEILGLTGVLGGSIGGVRRVPENDAQENHFLNRANLERTAGRESEAGALDEERRSNSFSSFSTYQAHAIIQDPSSNIFPNEPDYPMNSASRLDHTTSSSSCRSETSLRSEVDHDSRAIEQKSENISRIGSSHQVEPLSGSGSPVDWSGCKIDQVSSISDCIIQAAEETNKVAQAMVNDLMRFNQASKTMVCLRAIDFQTFPQQEEAAALAAMNVGKDFSNTFLVLNKSSLPLTVPSSDHNKLTYVIPPIIPSSIKLQVEENGQKVEKSTSSEPPTEEENKAILKLITDALEIYCGVEKAQELLVPLNAPEKVGQQITIEDLSSILEAAQEEQSKIPLIKFSEHLPAMPVKSAEVLGEHLFPNPMPASFEEAYETLALPEKALLQFFYHAAETVAKTGGVVAAGAAGVALPVAFYGAVGVVGGATAVIANSMAHGSGMFIGMGASSITSFSVGALIHNKLRGRVDPELSRTIAYGWVGSLGGIVGEFAAITTDMHSHYAGSLAHAAAIGASAGAIKGYGLGLLFGGTVLSPFLGAMAVLKASDYLLPGVALKKTNEALSSLRGEKAEQALLLMKEAQANDKTVLQALGTFFESLPEAVLNDVPLENAKNSSSSLAMIDARSENISAEGSHDSSYQLKNFGDVQAILKKSVEQRMAERSESITKLSEKLQAVKKRNAEILRSRVRSLRRG